MKQHKTLLVLWLIFGYIFIRSMDAIAYLLTELITLIGLGLNINLEIMSYGSYPIVFITYLSGFLIVLKKIKLNSEEKGIHLTRFPKTLFLICSAVTLSFPYLTSNYISSEKWEMYTTIVDNMGLTYDEELEYSTHFISHASFSQFYIYIGLIILYFVLIRRIKK